MRYSTEGSCKLECNLASLEGKRYRVANHRYVGSYYGKANAKLIQEELYRNGPLAIGLEPDDEFMFYSDGIYKSSRMGSPTGGFRIPGDLSGERMAFSGLHAATMRL